MTTKKFILKTLASVFIVVLLFSALYQFFLVSTLGLQLFLFFFAAVIYLCGVFAVRSTIQTIPKSNKWFLLKLYGSTLVLSALFANVNSSILGNMLLNIYKPWIVMLLSVAALFLRQILFAVIVWFSHRNQIEIGFKISLRFFIVVFASAVVAALIGLALRSQILVDNTSQVFIYLMFITPMIEGVVGVMLTALWICNSSKGIQKKAVKKRKQKKRNLP